MQESPIWADQSIWDSIYGTFGNVSSPIDVAWTRDSNAHEQGLEFGIPSSYEKNDKNLEPAMK